MEYIRDCIDNMNREMDARPQQTAQALTVVRLGRSRLRSEEQEANFGRVSWFAHNVLKLGVRDKERRDEHKIFDNNVGDKYWHSVDDMMQQLTRPWDCDWLRGCDMSERWSGLQNASAPAPLMDMTCMLLNKNKLDAGGMKMLHFEEYVVFSKEREGCSELLVYMYERTQRHAGAPFFQSYQTPLKHAVCVERNVSGRQLYDYYNFLQTYRAQQGTVENPYSPNVVKKLQDIEMGCVAEHRVQATLVPEQANRILCQTELFRLRYSRFVWIVDTCWFVVMSQCSHRVPATTLPSNYGFDTWEIDMVYVTPHYHLYNMDDSVFGALSLFVEEYFETRQRLWNVERPLEHATVKRIMWWKYNKMSHSRFATGQSSSLNVKQMTAAAFDVMVRHTSLYDQLRQRCQYLFSNLPFDVNRHEFEHISRTNADPLQPSHHKMLFSAKPDGVLAVAVLVAGQDICIMTRNYTLMRVHNSRAQCQRVRRLLELKYPSVAKQGKRPERVFLLEGELVEAHFKASQELYHLAHYEYVPAMVIFSMSYFNCRDESLGPPDKTLLWFLRYTPLSADELASLLRAGHDDVKSLEHAPELLQGLTTNDNRLFNMCGCQQQHGDDVFCMRTLLQEHAQFGVDVVTTLRIVQNTPLLLLHKMLFASLMELKSEYGSLTHSVEDMFPCDSSFEVSLDGVIIAPRLSGFCTQQPGTEVWAPVDDERRKTYKWKPLEKRTMDFECRVSSCGRHLLLFAMDSDLVMQGSSGNYIFNMDRHTRRLNMHRLTWEQVQFGERFCERHLVAKPIKDYFAEAKDVHEFSYSPVSEKWSVINVRKDKKQPNSVVVVTDILMHLVSTLTLDDMLHIENTVY